MNEDLATQTSCANAIKPAMQNSLLQVRRYPASKAILHFGGGELEAPGGNGPASNAKLLIGGDKLKAPGGLGVTASLDEDGYHQVAVRCCDPEMDAYARRVLFELSLVICNEGDFRGMLAYHTCEKGPQTFDRLREAVLLAQDGDCSWVSANTSSCHPQASHCGFDAVPSSRRRVCAYTTASPMTAITTTSASLTTTRLRLVAPTTVTTTTAAIGCLGAPKDIVIMIDASKSVGGTGWAAEANFAERLIGEVMDSGNPNRHKINLHWFNKATMPIGQTGSKNSPGIFSPDGTSAVSALKSIGYSSIRDGSTDHPQVYMTAEAAFESSSAGARTGVEKVLVSITSGETRKGTGCKNLPIATMEARIGRCTGNTDHACFANGCDAKTCMCGLYHAALFKDHGYKLVVVGIENRNHIGASEAAVLNRVMHETSSPDESYIAPEFEDLQGLIAPLVKNLCK